jgi:glycosyltransferase involved in cell wall biosynthesis
VFPSDTSQKLFLEKIDAETERTSVVYSGISVDEFTATVPKGVVKKEDGTEKFSLFAGIIARLSPVKGHEYFLNMAKTVVEREKSCCFVVSGEDAQITLDELRDRAAELGIAGNVVFLEKMPDPRMVMTDLDIGIVTSRDSEVVCRVAAEYMALRKPVIATGINVLPEMIAHGETGYICCAANPDEMAEKVLYLARNPGKIEKMGENGYRRAKAMFDTGEMVDRTLSIYEKYTS